MCLIGNPMDSLRLTEDDRVNIYIAYSTILTKLKLYKEAKNILAEAKLLFLDTKQEIIILLASSQLAIERKDYDSAIRMLDSITNDNINYNYAQIIKAEIILNYHHDKEGFINCYLLLIENNSIGKLCLYYVYAMFVCV